MAVPARYPRRWWTLGALCFSLFIITLDNTILNVALPTLVRALHATTSQLQWMVDAYVLLFAGLLLTAGTLGDRFGRKRLLMLGLAVFGACSFLAGLSGSAGQLIAMRALMGIGSAMIMPATLSVLDNIFVEPERGKAIGIWAAVAGLAIPIGPVVGGWLLEHYSWSSIFFVNVPIAIAALIAGHFLVPESRDPEAKRLDPVGAILSIAALTTLLYGIIEAPSRGWTSGLILGAFAAAILLLAGFFLWERTTSHPMFDIRLFERMRFTGASLALMLIYFGLFGTLFFLTMYLQFVLGFSTLQAGVRMLPIALGIALTAPISAPLAQRFGSKLVVCLGLMVLAAGIGTFARATAASGYDLVALAMILGGLGMGLSITPATDSVMGAVPREQAGVGSAMNDTTREVGGALGIAIMGSILSTSFNHALAPVTAQLPPQAATVAHDSIGGAFVVAQQLGGNTGQLILTTARSGFIHAMSLSALTGAGVAVAAAALVLLLLPAFETQPAVDVAQAVEEAEVKPAV